MTSIQVLNEKLADLDSKSEYEITIPANQEIDIAFVAGILLWHIKKEGETKLSLKFLYDAQCKTFTIKEESSRKEHSGTKAIKTISFDNEQNFFNLTKYLQQFEEIFKTRIEIELLYPKNGKETEDTTINPLKVKDIGHFKEIENTLPLSYAPILYIDKETIDRIFDDKNNHYENKKNKYIEELKRRATRNQNEKTYFKADNNIIEFLKSHSFIHTLVFAIAYEKTKPFTSQGENNGKILVDKLWQFTKNYVRGLYELAKNIVEHSGEGFGNGAGIITIRAYQEHEKDKVRTLETHVFDYGKTGIIPKLADGTKKKEKEEVHNSIKECYIADNKRFDDEAEYNLIDFIAPKRGRELEQQKFRHTSHYGIGKLNQLLGVLSGEMIVRSTGRNKKPDIFGASTEEGMLQRGTHYFLRVRFDRDKFEEIEVKTIDRQGQKSVLGQRDSFKDFSKQNMRELKLSELHSLPDNMNKSLIIISDIEVEKITKENIDNIYAALYKINLFKNKTHTIAINLHGKINDPSILLRFLSHLTSQYEQSFVVYGVNYRNYNDLLKDNYEFFKSRGDSEDYWHTDRSILLFVKEEDNDFYFADILFGKKEGHSIWVNRKVNMTFPNTIAIHADYIPNTDMDKPVEPQTTLDAFFLKDSNLLLPFDALLKNNEGKELILSNLKVFLNNPLIRENKYEGISGSKGYSKKFDGYHINNTHFKVGHKVHSKNFYYAKRLFQNSFYTARLAMILSIKINKEAEEKKILKDDKILLVGYEMYSELLLSLISKFLREVGYTNIRHCVGIDNNEVFFFKPDTNFYVDNKGCFENSKAIIIVPIASTGSTAGKIKKAIQKHVKDVEKIEFPLKPFNVILAQSDDDKFKPLMPKEEQEHLIKLAPKWYPPRECDLCWGSDTKPLFATDKTYLTPALIFNNPQGKSIKERNNSDIDKTKVTIDKATLSGRSLFYKMVNRNNEFFLFSINTPQFIKENNEGENGKITEWLKDIGKEIAGEINTDDKTPSIVILAPCHETNSEFLNLVNEHVFQSSATIIHHQVEGDYMENFRSLNKELLNKDDVKIFYVDDNLISGRQFSNLYRLFRDTVENGVLSGGILLRDSSSRETHERFFRQVGKKCYVYASYNLPPILILDSKKPLEHERKRYEDLRDFALHDVLIKIFDDNERELNVHDRADSDKTHTTDDKKHKRHWKMLLITDAIYAFFSEEDRVRKNIETDLYPHIIARFPEWEGDKKDTKLQLLKVLSQYPFLLYKDLKEETFNWHKQLLTKSAESLKKKLEWAKTNQDKYKSDELSSEYYNNIFSYDDFRELKFLIRRAIFLDNYQITSSEFLSLLAGIFDLIQKHADKDEKIQIINYRPKDLVLNMSYLPQKLNESEQQNLEDFHIYLVRNFLELAHKNGWVAVKLLDNLKKKESEFHSNEAKQFVRMLRIELAAVVNDFNSIITTSFEKGWLNACEKSQNRLDLSNSKIIKFLNDDEFFEKEKYKIATSVLGKAIDNDENNPLINYYWIKQLIFNDAQNDPELSEGIDLQNKIDAIMEKAKTLFGEKRDDVEAFFVVTDKQDKAYVMFDDNRGLHDLEEKPEGDKFKIINILLKGIVDSQRILVQSINEFVKDNGGWKNAHTTSCTIKYRDRDEKISFDFLPKPDNKKYMLLVRFSQFNGHKEPRNLGLMGFCCKDDLSTTPEGLLAKQLLMLLRRDMGDFIIKHHKNDEFSAFRALETIKRFTYLAGHGRHSMQKLAGKHKEFFEPISTMDTLQFLYANNIYKAKAKTEENESMLETTFMSSILSNIELREAIKFYVDKIYSSPELENKVIINMSSSDVIHDTKETGYDTSGVISIVNLDGFQFNKKILLFILFELIINAKKNRWHCIRNEDSRCKKCKNFIKIDIKLDDDTLKLVVKTTGTTIENNNRLKINEGTSIKKGYDNEGLYLIRKIIEGFNKANTLIMDESKDFFEMEDDEDIKSLSSCLNEVDCDFGCELKVNTTTITLKNRI